ncbi:hypothetical protein ASG43_04780 [Aureimonas sp. Leaf454]|uniref:condensation domain-containing protein n=1 Tax=Aureimonas sp. Leaf454 TaxID=1736381 RepID=UPI0006FCC108|nr:condensation domain-containing protein [Aureimonas sp. Leaf454]KQT54860.1 hypothetical protein ASG43_04780 [Aureimonas sp. Leaf454]
MTIDSRIGSLAELPRALRDAVFGKLVARRRASASPAEASIPHADRTGRLPVSLEQAFILRQQSRFGGRVAWTIAAPPLILEDVDVEALRRAVAVLTRRHDALHMTIEADGEGHRLRLDPGALPPLTVTRLPLTAALTGLEAWIRKRYERMLALGFDPETGPLWRAELVSRGKRGVLLTSFCSLVADGEALHLVAAELMELYEAERGGASLAEPVSPRLDYADYAAAQATDIRAGRFEGALGWWRARLAGGPPVSWSTGAQAREGAGSALLYEQVLSPRTGRALDAFAALHRTTPHVVLLTEFLRVLRRIDGEDDLWVASATTARDRAQTRAMVGSFARLMPLRLSWPDSGEPLDAVHAALVETMDREPVPHLLLQDMLETAHPGASSAFRYIFNHRLVGETPEEKETADVAFRPGPPHAEAAREEDILLMVLQSGERRELHWYLRADRFRPADAEEMLGDFLDVLRLRISSPDFAAT